jgi:hypothetical protein
VFNIFSAKVYQEYVPLGISKKSVNIAARAEISQYPLDVYIKLQVLKYMARISNKDNNPLLLDAYSLGGKKNII